MAKRRILKKDISYVAGELFTEVLICQAFVPGTEQEKADAVLSRILEMQDEFISRAQRPDGNGDRKHVKEYYRKLRANLQAEVDAIGEEIASLSKAE